MQLTERAGAEEEEGGVGAEQGGVAKLERDSRHSVANLSSLVHDEVVQVVQVGDAEYDGR